jgi:hypothetical protein
VQPLRLEAAVPTSYEGLWGAGHLCSTEDIADIHVRLSQEGDRAQKDALRVVARQQGRLLGLMAVRNDVRSSAPITSPVYAAITVPRNPILAAARAALSSAAVYVRPQG